MEKLSDKSHVVSYEEHMIFQRGNAVGFDIFLRMEFLQGIKEGMQISSMRNQEVLLLGKDICEALRVCEIHHIVHGDIRPETIFVTVDKRFKLGDFSFARYCGQSDITLLTQNLGDYMAPEVYMGKTYDIRADIYSLGLVLYQYLNDYKLPYLDVSLEVATREQRLAAVNQRFQAQVLPKPCNATDELAKVVAKACEVNPKLRYQGAEEFKDALTAIGIFLGSDISAPVKDFALIQDEIYVRNEVIISPNNIIRDEKEQSHKSVNIKRANIKAVNIKSAKIKGAMIKGEKIKDMRPFIIGFLVLVLTTSVIVLFTNIDLTKKANSKSVVEVITSLPDITLIPESITVVSPTNIPTQALYEDAVITPIDESTQVLETSSTMINMSGQELYDFSSIEGIDRAETIDLSNNQLSDINPLKDAMRVKTLALSNNQIVSVEPLRDLTHLKALDISGNNVTSLVMLRKLDKLEILSASDNLITSLEGMEKLTTLKILYLNDNLLEDISILKELTSLEFIDLSNNKVEKEDIEEVKKALPACIIVE
jgi:serine/threonine protein kinase